MSRHRKSQRGGQTTAAPRPIPPEILGAPAAQARLDAALCAAVEADGHVGAGLASTLPARLPAGVDTALFLDGFCHPREVVSGLALLVNGRAHDVATHGMPLPGAIDPGCYWWTIVRIGAREIDGDEVRFALRAEAPGGSAVELALGSVPTTSAPAGPLPAALVPPPDRTADGLVAICMATYNPVPEHFSRQVESIRAQTHRDWVCLISDDGSSADRYERMVEIVGDDPRFAVARAEERLGFYGNFERALAMAPPQAAFATFADQDDYWFPDKIEVLLEAMEPGVQLAYSDMRIVLESGEVISETYWTHRRNNYTNLGSLLLANTVTGAASIFRRELLDLALPFPPRHGEMYHDHWIALVALARGRIAYVRRPLYDYVQHGDAVLGYANANASALRRVRRSRLARARDRFWRIRFHGHHLGWRGYYFRILARAMVLAHILEQRCGKEMSRRKRRTVGALLAADRPLPFRTVGWLLARLVRAELGARETFGMERIVLRAVVWRRFASLRRLQQRGSGCRHGTATPALGSLELPED